MKKAINEIISEWNLAGEELLQSHVLWKLIKENIANVLKIWNNYVVHRDFVVIGDLGSQSSMLFNKIWSLKDGMPKFKITFCFNDTKLLDNCPYVCKVGFNYEYDQNCMFFGVVYGKERDLDEIVARASQFPYQQLLNYE